MLYVNVFLIIMQTSTNLKMIAVHFVVIPGVSIKLVKHLFHCPISLSFIFSFIHWFQQDFDNSIFRSQLIFKKIV